MQRWISCFNSATASGLSASIRDLRRVTKCWCSRAQICINSRRRATTYFSGIPIKITRPQRLSAHLIETEPCFFFSTHVFPQPLSCSNVAHFKWAFSDKTRGSEENLFVFKIWLHSEGGGWSFFKNIKLVGTTLVTISYNIFFSFSPIRAHSHWLPSYNLMYF